MSNNTEKISHYEWMACFFINDDLSGYSMEEITEIERFESQLKEYYGDSVRVMDCSECTGFGTPDYGGPKGDLCEYLVEYKPQDLPSEHWQSHKEEALKSRYW
ncbi:hypothetical protein [Sphaerochaeta globosa]|uniref:Uncharacterized protein n=1 Tax=Sphaerochaeta globosa (strain ATCC BAA-1886 / DSM 22777 / Buddy) TaxID=158189 RepID=F0RTH7_SPHGB|nr:hypothetical protein [Sphaerochaeta globosa]ADY14172.1 hypothetical protein SpiBuddy_2357 [Sphaerochaeta globosa str. Buddy]